MSTHEQRAKALRESAEKIINGLAEFKELYKRYGFDTMATGGMNAQKIAAKMKPIEARTGERVRALRDEFRAALRACESVEEIGELVLIARPVCEAMDLVLPFSQETMRARVHLVHAVETAARP